MKTSLSTRILQFVTVLCLGLGISVLTTFHTLTEDQASRLAERDVQSVSSLLRGIIQSRSSLLTSITRFISSSPRVASLAGTDSATVGQEIARIRQEAGVDAIVLTDRMGNPLGSDGFSKGFRFELSEADLKDALADKATTAIEELDGNIMIGSSRPLKVAGVQQGLVIAFFRLGSDRAKELRGDSSLEVAFTIQGKVTGASFPIRDDRLDVVDRSWKNRSTGRLFTALYSPIPQTHPKDQLGFVVLRPIGELMAPFREFTSTFLLLLVEISIIALIVGFIFARRNVASLQRLVESAAKLKDGFYGEPIPVTQTDEIGLLQSTFNEMSTAIRASQDRLLGMIDVDPLTDLDNHRRFQERLVQESSRATVSGQSLHLLMIDIDKFVGFNHRNGLTAGDTLLKRIAMTLKEASPEFATVARYSGEEFVVLLPNGTERDATDLFDELQSRISEVSLSAGISELTALAGRTEDMVLAAELAMLRAKELGGGQACEFGAVPGSTENSPVALYRLSKDGSYATIKALAAAVDAKDPYTHGHSDRVAEYASELARYQGAPSDLVDLIQRCGTLHDVGKIGVPDAILQKHGPLTTDEFRTMQTHAVLGEKIVSRVPQLNDLLPGVRHHHERYDGKGYPDGLKGTDIPLVARYLAIADTFDAMTSDRPYRRGMDRHVALDEIRKQAGSQFDPTLAIAFTEMMAEQRQIA